MNVTIAQRLAALRREHGLTQEQLAERIGVSRQAVSKWERTESSPDTDNLIALARLYGVTLDELLYGSGAEEALDAGPASESDEAAGTALADAAEESESPSGTGDPGACPSDEGDPTGAADTDTDGSAGARDRAECWWDDRIYVDSDDSTVSVGWDGVIVDDHRSGDHVEVGPGGIHVNASDGKHRVRTEDDGSVWIDGTRYDSWAETHRAMGHGNRPRALISRVPYVPVALIAFVVLGICGHWDVGGAFLAVIPVWGSLCSVADARVRGKKLRGPVTGLCFWAGLSAFLMTGLLTGMWHPAWMLVVGGLVLSILVGALWPRSEGPRPDGGTGGMD